MPLPFIPFPSPQQPAQPKLEYETLADDSSDDIDGILSMLRGRKCSEETANSKNRNGNNPSEETPSSIVSSKTANSQVRRTVKFDNAGDKIGRGRNLEAPQAMQQVKVDSDKVMAAELVADSKEINVGETLEDGSATETNPSRRGKANTEAEPSAVGALTRQRATPIKTKRKHNHSESTSESYEDLLHRILSSQLSIQEICFGIKELQTNVAPSSTQGDEASKTIEKLIEGVAKNHDELKLLTESMRLSNTKEKENIFELQLCAEKERKAFMEHLVKEKSMLADRWDSYEKNATLLCAQRKELELERDAVLIEKENLLKEKIKFQQNEALFEQRKVAAKEEMNLAEASLAKLHNMDAKLQSEMAKLLELSDFVTRKDAEANEKLAEADYRCRQAQELESIIQSAYSVIEEQKQRLSEDRYELAQERVRILKEKSSGRRVTASGNPGSNVRLNTVAVEHCKNSSHANPSFPIRNRLVLLKRQLDKLMKE